MEQAMIKIYVVQLEAGYGDYATAEIKEAAFLSMYKELDSSLEMEPWVKEGYQTMLSYNCTKRLWSSTQLLEASELGIKFETVEVKKVYVNPRDIFQNVKDKSSGEAMVSAPAESVQYNTKCNVHMPGQALSLYNDVLLLEDSCTDVLSEHLSKGWRIVAACPQPDQRRPDYILGRYTPPEDL